MLANPVYRRGLADGKFYINLHIRPEMALELCFFWSMANIYIPLFYGLAK